MDHAANDGGESGPDEAERILRAWSAAREAWREGAYERVVALLEPLAAEGHVDSQFVIGNLFHGASGFASNYAAAVRWLRLAAQAGHVRAGRELAELLERGLGAPKDVAAAVEWYERAAAAGDEKAALALDRLYLTRELDAIRPDPYVAADSEGRILHWPVEPVGAWEPLEDWEARLWDAAHNGEWDAAMRDVRPRDWYVNRAHPRDGRGRTLLHLAALHGAPHAVVDELLALGAWRSLPDVDGQVAHELARQQGRGALAERLRPVYVRPLPLGVDRMQALLHDLMASRGEAQLRKSPRRLPPIGPMFEYGRATFWYAMGPIGGFSCRIRQVADEAVLLAHSRHLPAARGGMMDHAIRASGVRVLHGG